MNRKWGSLCVFLAAVILIQIIGAIFTSSSVNSWYPTLQKASWNPPGWVFGPVWTVLYLMIAFSGWLVFLQPLSKKRTRALWAYGVQLGLNFLWSFFFFFLQNPALGLLDIIILLVAIWANIYYFFPLSKMAALLLVPYFFWTAYAVTLNAAIVIFQSK